jgi:transposase-like protein
VVGLFFSLARGRRCFSAGGSGILIFGVRLDVDTTYFAERNCAIEAMSRTMDSQRTDDSVLKRLNRLSHLRGQAQSGKAIVMRLLERHGKAHVKVVPKTRRFHLVPEIHEHVEQGSNLYTDALRSYSGLYQYAHEVIDHTEAYVRGAVHTNGLENFWSLFKRALKGTYVSVEPYHLQAYADQQCFRFNERKSTDFQRSALTMMQIVGRRLTYNELTGKQEELERDPG